MKWTRLLALWGIVAVGSLGAVACDDDDDPVDPEPEPPAAVTNVQASASGQSVTVTWAASANATGYDVTLKSATQPDQSETVTNTTATFSGLQPSTTYSAEVVATNAEGSSPVATSNLVTTAAEELDFVEVTGDIDQNTTWTSDKTWVLTQPIFVGTDCGPDPANPTNDCDEVTLTIEPGTTVVGKVDLPQGIRSAFIVVNRGSRIVADANADVGGDKNVKPAPEDVIVFTSERARGSRGRGDWGGIILNGRARINTFDDDDGGALGEGNSGFFGGTDDNDDSGILRGVRIEFAGDDATPTDQLNGLALQGTGAGTTLSYIQIHYNTDDGIEPYGGTASVNNLVVTGIGDDSVDGTDGYRGFMQFIVGQQRGDAADQGMELSNNAEDGDETPKTTAVITNATMIGANDDQVSGSIAGASSDHGVLFREGSNYRVYNSIFTGFGDSGLCIENAVTVQNADNRLAGMTDPDMTLSFEGNILWNNNDPAGGVGNFCDDDYSQAEAQAFFANWPTNLLADPGLPASAFDVGSQGSPPDVIPPADIAGYTAFDLSTLTYGDNLVQPVDGRTIQAVDYPGAVEPGTALNDAWYTGWTVWSTDGSDSRPNQNGN